MTYPTELKTEAEINELMQPLAQAAVALGVNLTGTQLTQFHTYYEELIQWNSRVNLTGITEWHEVLTKHFLDSLSVCLAIPDDMKSGGAFLDVGAGAGFPGIPIRVAYPGIRGTLLDSTAKKTAFLTHLIDVLALDGITVITDRAETLARVPEHREGYNLVFGRGVANMAVLAELTLPFARVGGFVIAQKLINAEDEIAAASHAFQSLGGELKKIIPVAQKGLENRALVVIEKTSPTPERYPRRPGIPAKRPL
ncbi:MAG: 16S rRNA (guanine(527)-N(7))-methyltransferase RsmG [Chloroflexi bacterium]|nr:16S rRNA (guanine(527)-N(7))-methyltransferase RsmG [Chloroflexota bacterium]MDA1227458.1 16S rRNA (guanine(527)-N(7))-methyltransferase RsmG [Chloroflexota bacterium]